MIIRSQNKKGIINLNNIDTIDVYDGQVRYFNGGGLESMGILGTYSTEEKAIKVLDMICDACRNIAFIDEQAVVFQMPQDSEVQA